jgi:hypothetical protein
VADLLTPAQRARLEVLTHDLPSKRHFTEAEIRDGVGAILKGIADTLRDRPENIIAAWLVELLPRVLAELEDLETELDEAREDAEAFAAPSDERVIRLLRAVSGDPVYPQLGARAVAALLWLVGLASRAPAAPPANGGGRG